MNDPLTGYDPSGNSVVTMFDVRAYILKQADGGLSVEEVCRKAGVSPQTYYRWWKK